MHNWNGILPSHSLNISCDASITRIRLSFPDQRLWHIRRKDLEQVRKSLDIMTVDINGKPLALGHCLLHCHHHQTILKCLPTSNHQPFDTSTQQSAVQKGEQFDILDITLKLSINESVLKYHGLHTSICNPGEGWPRCIQARIPQSKNYDNLWTFSL